MIGCDLPSQRKAYLRNNFCPDFSSARRITSSMVPWTNVANSSRFIGYLLRAHSASVLQQLPCNHQPLYLTRAFANGAQLHITIKLFRRIVFDEAIATVDLHAFVR